MRQRASASICGYLRASACDCMRLRASAYRGLEARVHVRDAGDASLFEHVRVHNMCVHMLVQMRALTVCVCVCMRVSYVASRVFVAACENIGEGPCVFVFVAHSHICTFAHLHIRPSFVRLVRCHAAAHACRRLCADVGVLCVLRVLRIFRMVCVTYS
jgi:hypothetical protein